MSVPTNIGEMRRLFTQRARDMNLTVSCPMDGAFGSEIAIVGDGPGVAECMQMMPFCGPAGKLLWDAFRVTKLSRMQVYMTNVIKRQMSYGKDADKEPINRHELDHWMGLLRWELSCLPNLKYILMLGSNALQAIAGEVGVSRWRGSAIDVTIFNTYQGFVALNPAVILREPRNEIVFRFDMGKFHDLLRGAHVPHITATRFDLSPKEAIDFMTEVSDRKTYTSIDIESVAGETACIGFAMDKNNATCINFRNRNENRWTTAEEREVRRAIQRTFEVPEIKWIAQNGNFDSYWMWYKDRMRINPLWMDTLLAHHTLYPKLPHNLGFLTSQYTTHPYYKDEKDVWREGGDIQTFWEYNGKDCCITWACAIKLLDELRDQQLDEFFFNHVMRLQPHLVLMTATGMKVSLDKKKKFEEDYTTLVDQLRQDFYKQAQACTNRDETFQPNPASPMQLGQLYFTDLRLVGRGSSTNEDNRTRMMEHPRTTEDQRKLLAIHDQFAKESKFLGTYVKSRIDEDGRIRCEYKQFGTQNAPGRLSSSETMWGSGTNLQNQPERAQVMYEADEDFVLCYFDLAQAEARVVAWEANIVTWKEQFERARIDGGYDCHRALAADMFGMPYDDVPTFDRNEDGSITLRFVSKRCRHGLNYRMQAPRLAQTTGLPMRDAYDAFTKYHRTTPELQVWWEVVEREVRDTKMLFNCYGRRLLFLERLDDDALESIIAFKPQSAIGDKVCRVIYLCHGDEKWPRRSRMLLNIHDALIALSHKDDAMRTLQIMKRHAEEPMYIRGEPLIIPADCKLSQPDEQGVHRWNNLKKVSVEI
jgi:uracil-DNA glycosylase family 4